MKKMNYQALALMGFTTVWGFGNVVNNYANQGLSVVTSWVLILAFYFLPYALMVGEMGGTYRREEGGLSAWVKLSTSKPMLAFFVGWTYWVVHIPYLAQKPQNVLIAAGWIFYQNGTDIKAISPWIIQFGSLAVFLGFMYLASRGINSLKSIGAMAGTAMFVMGILYILMTVAAPSLRGVVPATHEWSWHTMVPKFDFTYFTTISMLVFAVGGCEKISPYVNELGKPDKDFPRAMILVAVMVGISALLGSLAMGIMFNGVDVPNDLKMNGQYYAFAKLGAYYGVGNSLLVLYALAQAIGQISVMMISIDAPLRMLIGDGNKDYIPKALTKTNRYGMLTNGYKMTGVLVSILIIVPVLGIGDLNTLYNWLLDLNSFVMPLRYLWVFVAYIALKGLVQNLAVRSEAGYKFVTNNKLGVSIGIWCFAFTAFACILGVFPKGVPMYSHEWYFQIILNIATPFVLVGLGFIMPKIARMTNK